MTRTGEPWGMAAAAALAHLKSPPQGLTAAEARCEVAKSRSRDRAHGGNAKVSPMGRCSYFGFTCAPASRRLALP